MQDRAEPGLAPEEILAAYQAWMKPAQIGTIDTPGGELRLFRLERQQETQQRCSDVMLGMVHDVRHRIEELEQALGLALPTAEQG